MFLNYKIHDIMLCIQTGAKYNQEDRENKKNSSNLRIISISLFIIAVIFLIVFFIIRYKKE